MPLFRVAKPKVRLALSGAQVLPGAANLVWDTVVDEEPAGFFVGPSSSVVVGHAGWWLIASTVRGTLSSGGSGINVNILVNGATVASTQQNLAVGVTAYRGCVATMLDLAVLDAIQINLSAATTVSPITTHLAVCRLGPKRWT